MTTYSKTMQRERLNIRAIECVLKAGITRLARRLYGRQSHLLGALMERKTR
ncbi:MAG TPA: hypothetical protein VFG81_03825 [Anaerolineales bacterium]|jgi:hypothetical protein|nr:hypothetical protein [Anaerolineales bacterium]